MATTIEKQTDTEDAINALWELIKDIRIAMMTTIEDDGRLRSRPMATQDSKFDGDLWFFTFAESGKVHEVQGDRHVNLSYANPSANTYVSVTGSAKLVYDQEKAKQLWKPFLKAWFPEGVDDPNLALLKINVEKAEYWDSPANAVVKVLGFLKGVTTGKPAQLGENKEVILNK